MADEQRVRDSESYLQLARSILDCMLGGADMYTVRQWHEDGAWHTEFKGTADAFTVTRSTQLESSLEFLAMVSESLSRVVNEALLESHLDSVRVSLGTLMTMLPRQGTEASA